MIEILMIYLVNDNNGDGGCGGFGSCGMVLWSGVLMVAIAVIKSQ